MLKVVEAFSGIGSQAKALKKLNKSMGIEYEVVNTIEWDINAIIAYDLIHNDNSIIEPFKSMSREELLENVNKYSLSVDGSSVAKESSINRLNNETLKRILTSISRNKNLVSILDVSARDLPDNIDILTYSFPCQDLSLSGYFHGDSGGIDRNAKNSSSMLWQVERILHEFNELNKPMPKALIMENVASITNHKHIDDFEDWIESLNNMGYFSKYYHLQSSDFGLPQSRKRTFMISIYYGENEDLKDLLSEELNGLFTLEYIENRNFKSLKLKNLLRTDYTNPIYFEEAKRQVPNYTKSRIKIFEENPKIFNGKKYLDTVRTITTKQDRHPNSGTILIDKNLFELDEEKSSFRYLTPRETFILMGFEEEDFNAIVRNNFKSTNTRMFFTDSKLLKLAGNSIVVNVIEDVFRNTILLLNRFNYSNYPRVNISGRKELI